MAGTTEASGAQRRPFWRELPFLIAVALILALLIKAFVVQAFRIPSGSMEDTLRVGDRVLVNKIVYDVRGLDRGDIVVFNGQGSWDPPASSASAGGFLPLAYHAAARWVGLESDGTDYIKRVIGLPGDRVRCCDAQDRVTVNGIPLNEGSYLYPGSNPSVQRFNVMVPRGRIWVMGDHRGDSADSRYHMKDPGDGTVPISKVVGRAFIVIWPLSQLQTLSIPTTFKQAALDFAGTQTIGPAVVPSGRHHLRWASAAADAAGSAVPLAGGFGLAVPALWLLRLPRRLGPPRGGRHRPGS